MSALPSPPLIRPLKPAEVAAALSLREFLALGKVLDDKYGEKIEQATILGSGWGGNEMNIASRRTQVKFDVLQIERRDDGTLKKIMLQIEKVGMVKLDF